MDFVPTYTITLTTGERRALKIALGRSLTEDLLRTVGVLVSAPVNRFGKPEFYSPEEMAARERIRTLAIEYGVTGSDTVLHQAGQVIRAALAEAGL